MILTQNNERSICDDKTSHILRGAGINSAVGHFHVYDKEHVVRRHHVHPSFPRGRKIISTVLLPSDLRRRVPIGGTFQTSGAPGVHSYVVRNFGECRINCAEKCVKNNT